MSIADKLTTVAENQQRVYDAGYEKGKAEGGAGIDYDKFWDNFQGGDGRISYYWAFAYGRFDDETFNPKYSIICSSGSMTGRNLFYNNTVLTDTKVLIDFTGAADLQQTFYGAKGLVTIRELKVKESHTYHDAFAGCNALKNITFVGTIGKSISFPNSPLTPASMKNIISCLKDYSGTSDADTQTLTFTSACWTALEADSTAPDGGTWKQYVQSKGWKV